MATTNILKQFLIALVQYTLVHLNETKYNGLQATILSWPTQPDSRVRVEIILDGLKKVIKVKRENLIQNQFDNVYEWIISLPIEMRKLLITSENYKLVISIFHPKQKLLLCALLLQGCFIWSAKGEWFLKWICNEISIDFNGNMCCYQYILFSLVLAGLATKEQIKKVVGLDQSMLSVEQLKIFKNIIRQFGSNRDFACRMMANKLIWEPIVGLPTNIPKQLTCGAIKFGFDMTNPRHVYLILFRRDKIIKLELNDSSTKSVQVSSTSLAELNGSFFGNVTEFLKKLSEQI